MKNFFTSAIIVLVINMNNQAHAQKGFSISVKGGSQLNYLRNSDDKANNSFKHKTFIGGNIGIGAGYNFTENLGVAIDASYSVQGRRYELNGNEYREKLNYVKLPVMFSYNTNPDRKISFTGKIGPQVSFLASSRLTDDDGNSIKEDTKDQYRSTTFGGVAIVGTQYRVAPRLYITSGLRFDYDFTNAEDDLSHGYQAGRAKSYNNTISLQTGLKYML
jgi:hypothetical protein